MDFDKFIGVIILIAIVVLSIVWASFGLIPRIQAMLDKNPKFTETILSGICEYKDNDEANVDFIWRRDEEDKSVLEVLSDVAKTCFVGENIVRIKFVQTISQNCTYLEDDFNQLMEEEEGLTIYINSTAGDYPPLLRPGHSYTLRAFRAGRKASYFKCLTTDMSPSNEKMAGGCGRTDSPPTDPTSANVIFSDPDRAAQTYDEAFERRTWPPCVGYTCETGETGGQYYHSIREAQHPSEMDPLADFCVYLDEGEIV